MNRPNSINEIFCSSLGKRFKTIRNELNLTQEELAIKLNVSRATLAKIELGEQLNPGIMIVSKLIDNGYNSNWIINGIGEMHL